MPRESRSVPTQIMSLVPVKEQGSFCFGFLRFYLHFYRGQGLFLRTVGWFYRKGRKGLSQRTQRCSVHVFNTTDKA